METYISNRVTPSGAEPPRATLPAENSRFEEVLSNLANELERGKRLIDAQIQPGRSLDAGQLIALQAGIYRYSEAVDLTAKLVDRTSSAVRTVIDSSSR